MENVKDLLDQIQEDVNDLIQKDFVFKVTNDVPNEDDKDLTFESGEIKKGKEIDTCVLFVDIRDSVKLVKSSHTDTMGRIYTAFIKSTIRVAHKCNGLVRNIIVDRVMVVFPKENCFQNAVECAITINHIASKYIDKKVAGHEFKCGIGIDYGKMRCIKVGIEKHGTENSDNKNLVWIGPAVNMASRLCDCANKEIILYKVVYAEYEAPMNIWGRPVSLLEYEWHDKMRKMTPEQIQELINEGKFKRIKSVEKLDEEHRYKPILISEAVYLGYAKECPNCNSITKRMWQLDFPHIKDIPFKVYGADLFWE